MPSEVIELFAVCAVEDIERGDARAFSLSRIDETGESRPFPILIVRTHANGYFGYVNSCPHEGIWLNFGEGDFFTPDRTFLKCGRHGSIFEIETGLCIEAPARSGAWSRSRSRWSTAPFASRALRWSRTTQCPIRTTNSTTPGKS
jgi:nitrite reductase/ring-hydroxylating ferredoxin subunit